MNKLQKVVERLSQFNNLCFTKKQWDIILEGCGCPKSTHFWMALRHNNLLIKNYRRYTLVDVDINSINKVYAQYKEANSNGVKKHIAKIKARQKAKECKGITFYLVGGVLTTEPPKTIE